jgi:hypothetical protein
MAGMVGFVDDFLPYEKWSELLAGNSDGPILFLAIGTTLLKHSFSNKVESSVGMLHQAIPLLDAELRKSQLPNMKLKLVIEIAKFVGFHDISLTKREEESRLLFEAALIVLLYFNKDFFTCPYPDTTFFLQVYPEFAEVKEDELMKLFHFANFMSCAQILLPAKGKKSHLLDLVTRITEGWKHKYVTGGGQTSSTGLRVLIYEREGGIFCHL